MLLLLPLVIGYVVVPKRYACHGLGFDDLSVVSLQPVEVYCNSMASLLGSADDS